MADLLVKKLTKSPPKDVSAEDLKGLVGRLQHGHQTQDSDHRIIACLLNISLSVFHPTAGSVETITDCGPEALSVKLQLTARSDGEGVSQGHFDLLWPAANLVSPCVTESHEPLPSSVRQGITVRGAETASALLLVARP